MSDINDLNYIEELKAENARLREDYNESGAELELRTSILDICAEEKALLREERDRLREENKTLRDYQTEKYDEVVDDNARLREALKAIIELVRRRDDAPDTVSPAISVAIESLARNALKETI